MMQEKFYPGISFTFLERVNFQKWQTWFSLLTLALLLCISNFYAYNHLVKNKNQFVFYQSHFAPAVMYACGQPFLNPQQSSEIDDFLNSKTDTVSCETVKNLELKPLIAFQSAEYYFIFSAGILWKIFGISWDSIIPLFLILYSASIAAMYCIFRLVMRNSFAFLLTGFLATSSMQMHYLLFLRDYSVAPFLLWIIWCSAKLVINNPSLKKRFLLCAAAGLLTGYGLGFRSDVLIIVPYFMVLLFFFAEKQGSFFQGKIIPVLLFMICFLPGGYPIMLKASEGNNLSHVMILGLSHEFLYFSSLQQPETYSIIPAYLDDHAYNIIQSFADRMYGVHDLLPFPGKQYDMYGNLFLLNYLYHLPADFLIHIYASIYQVLILPFQYHPNILYDFVRKTAIFFPLFSIVFLAFYRFRLALCVLFAVIYLCAYPAIQFDPRHYFYLDFIGLWFAGLTSELFISFFFKKDHLAVIQQIQALVQTRWKIVFVTGVSFFMTGYGLLYAARVYQTNTLKQTFNQYMNLPKTSLERNQIDADTIHMPIRQTKIPGSLRMPLVTYFLKVTIENCPLQEIGLKLNYLEEPEIDIPREIKISGKDGVYFFPFYSFYNSGPHKVTNLFLLATPQIDNIQVSSIENACLKDFSVVHTDHTTPLLLNTQLVTGWEKNKLYQEFL